MARTEYSSTRLLFRADEIEPLSANDTIVINTPDGTFKMTKADFYRVFSNVVESESYKVHRIYHYRTTPKKAIPFLVNSEPEHNEMVSRSKQFKGLDFEIMESNNADEAFLISKELVENLFQRMAKVCEKFCNEKFCDLPYYYTERRLDSVILPVLSELCDSIVMTELPTERKRRGEEKPHKGRIDYWCIYKDYSFVIELKHSFDVFTTDKTRKNSFIGRWNTMIKQLKEVKSDVKTFSEKTKGVIRLGLHMVSSRSFQYPDEELIDIFNREFPETMERFSKIGGSKHKPDLVMCWKIPRKIILHEDNDVTIPGLWVLAKFFPPIPHQGSK